MRRGVEAVFQLLIGVITAIMVITVAFRVLSGVQMNRCSDSWHTSAVHLAEAIADAARSTGATDFVQLRGRCGKAYKVVYYLRVHTNQPKICNMICHKPVNTCYDVVYEAYGKQGSEDVLLNKGYYCADISPFSYYLMSQSSDAECASSSGVEYQNVTSDLLKSGGSEGVSVTSVLLNAYIHASGYGSSKQIYLCVQKV